MPLKMKNRMKITGAQLSNEETNDKLYEERRLLTGRWFDKWNDDQRRRILSELIAKCKPKQVSFVKQVVEDRSPMLHKDFTKYLPRVLSLYIISFLDPRSLSRCSQVSWHWKYHCELDQLWMPKCLRLGWYLDYTPSPYESSVWKRLYVQQIRTLQIFRVKQPTVSDAHNTTSEDMEYFKEPEHTQSSPSHSYDDDEEEEENPPRLDLDKLTLGSERRRSQKSKSKQPTPWKGSDPHPIDTLRFNVLDNGHDLEAVNTLRRRGYYGTESHEISRHARSRVKSASNNRAKRPSSAGPRLRHMSDSVSSTPVPNGSVTERRTNTPKTNTLNGHASPSTTTAKTLKTLNGHSATVRIVSPKSQSGKPPIAARPASGRSDKDNHFPSTPWLVHDTEDDEQD